MSSLYIYETSTDYHDSVFDKLKIKIFIMLNELRPKRVICGVHFKW